MKRLLLASGLGLGLFAAIVGSAFGREPITARPSGLRAGAAAESNLAAESMTFHDAEPGTYWTGGEECGAECSDCGPDGCLPKHRLCPHHSPGDMPPHEPYVAEPKLYYYFRPYNWHHIVEQQESVMSFGGDPRHPYANYEFRGIYEGLE